MTRAVCWACASLPSAASADWKLRLGQSQGLLIAVAVFVASSVIWMFLPWHKSDYRGVPDEAAGVYELASVSGEPNSTPW